jgi:hypothetical protein
MPLPKIEDLTKADFQGNLYWTGRWAMASHRCNNTPTKVKAHLHDGYLSFRCDCGDTVFVPFKTTW